MIFMEEQVYPEPAAGALIVNKKGEILLCRSHKWPGKFTFPGGHVELGETIEQALKREVKEEVGLDVEVGPFLTVQEFVFGPGFHKKRHFIFLDYVCYALSTDIKLDGREIQETVWVRPEEVLGYDLEPYAKKTIEVYLKTK